MNSMDWMLNFKNKSLEAEFLSSHYISTWGSRRLVNFIILCYITTHSLRYVFDGIFNPTFSLKETLIGLVALMLVTVVFFLGRFLLTRYKVKSTKIDIIVTAGAIAIEILLNNPIRSSRTLCDPSYSLFWSGFEIMVFTLIISHVLRRWFHKAIHFSFNCIYFFCLYQVTTEDHLVAIKMIGFIIMSGFLFYFIEKNARQNYFEKYQQEISTIHIFQAIPEGILIIDDEFKCIHSNPALKNLFPDLKPSNSSNLESFTQSILYPKPIFINHNKNSIPAKLLARQSSKISKKSFSPASLIAADETLINFPLNASNSIIPGSGARIKGKEQHTMNATLKGIPDDHSIGSTIDATSLFTYIKILFQLSKENENGEDTLEHCYFDAKHEDKTLEISLSSLNFLNKRCFLVIFRDKTESERIAQLENSSKYKSLVLATVSHELRTPVNSSLQLLTSVIETEPTTIPEDCMENYIKPAKKVLVMMLSLINDILDYSQLNEDKLKIVFQPTDIKRVITEAVGLIDIQAKKKGIYLELELDPKIPSVFETDPNRFTQILLNLLSNAYKFTSKGGITVSADMLTDPVPGRFLKVSVRDTGIGIKEEDINKLFLEFEKVELGKNEKLNPNGCGLGLSIANKLAKNLNKTEAGGIDVSSEPERGSVFSFIIENQNQKRKDGISNPMRNQKKHSSHFQKSNQILLTSVKPKQFYETSDESFHNIMEMTEGEHPLHLKWPKQFQFRGSSKQTMRSVRSETDDTTNQDTHCFVPKLNKKKKVLKCQCPQILLVDDSSLNLFILERMVKSLGYSVKSAFNGKEAVEEIINRSKNQQCKSECENFMTVFMDCVMPIKDGFEAAKEIKSFLKKKGLQTIPIIALSAHSEEMGSPEAFAAGMDYYLCKPASQNDIKRVLEKIEVSVLKNTRKEKP